MNTEMEAKKSRLTGLIEACKHLADDESGIAMTEYIMVFTFITFGATIALLTSAVYIKAYRDFMIWWLAHPAI